MAFGVVAADRTLAIPRAAIDLSIAALVSASPVAASVTMDRDPSRIPPAVAAVMALGGLAAASAVGLRQMLA